MTDSSPKDLTAILVELGQYMRKLRDDKGVKTSRVKKISGEYWSHSRISSVETGKSLPGEDLFDQYINLFCSDEQQKITMERLFKAARGLASNKGTQKEPAPPAAIVIEQPNAPGVAYDRYTRTTRYNGRSVQEIYIQKTVRATRDNIASEVYRVRFNKPMRSVQAVAIGGCVVGEPKKDENTGSLAVHIKLTKTLMRDDTHTYDFKLLVDMEESEPYIHVANRTSGDTAILTVRIQFDPNCMPTAVRTRRNMPGIATPDGGTLHSVDAGGYVEVEFWRVQPYGACTLVWDWPKRTTV